MVSRAIVTGSQGFIGRAVTEALRKEYEVITVDKAAGADVENDLVNVRALPDCEVVVHCAALADISHNWRSADDREQLYHDNIIATIQLLETVKTSRFVLLSSAALCEGVYSPYAATKLACEGLVSAYARRFGWAWSALRLAAVVGKGYRHGHVVDFVRSARSSGQVLACTDGSLRNPYVHLDDVVDAIGYSMLKPTFRAATVIGPSRWSWRDTVEVMRELGMSFEVIAPTDRRLGWVGDPDLAGLVHSDWPCERPIKDGVRDAIESIIASEGT